jgi:uncharacterized SAM-binding protein YcdF (DUF218 family)
LAKEEDGVSGCLIIFGAAVRSDGTPSGTLSRRIAGALDAAKKFGRVTFLVTGGAGKNGIVEAEAMKSLLIAADISDQRIITERKATDTFESILYCDALLRQMDHVDWVAPCTSRYHLLRCRLLLRMLGWTVRHVEMPSDWGHVRPHIKLISYYFKELVSTPYDLLLLLAYMLRRKARDAAR